MQAGVRKFAAGGASSLGRALRCLVAEYARGHDAGLAIVADQFRQGRD